MASILVVEDDSGINNMLCDALSLEGHSVVGMRRLDSPGSLNLKGWPDLAILDIMLNECSGVEIAGDLRRKTTCPLIALSASPLMVQVAEDSGLFRDVLMKPFDLTDLLSTVQRALEGSQA